jgi:V8-like Glu-specific endopeptidase
MPRPLDRTDAKRLETILADRAVIFAAGVQAFFPDLVRRSRLPIVWVREMAGGWTGDAAYDARRLIRWAEARGRNPADPSWATLGSVLRTLIEDEDLGLDETSELTATIAAYSLSPHVPVAPSLPVDGDEGPEFTWRGSTDVVELQSWRPAEPPLLDVAFLALAMKRSASVCRVEVSPRGGGPRFGTGVLVAADMVLTNHHVLQWSVDENLEQNAAATTVTFGCVTTDLVEASREQTFRLASDSPVRHVSDRLDYVLLHVEATIRDARNIAVAPFGTKVPVSRSGLHILQHPGGGTMKLAVSSNGVTHVNEREGVVQYVTTAAPGSSGAPCFDDDWNVVALHHAQRSRSFGRVGEGILTGPIVERIRTLTGFMSA